MNKGNRTLKLEEMVGRNPDAPFPRYALALEYRSAGLNDEARELFEGLVERHPDYVPTYLQFALLLQDLGEEQKMAEVVRIGLREAARQGDRKAVDELTRVLEE